MTYQETFVAMVAELQRQAGITEGLTDDSLESGALSCAITVNEISFALFYGTLEPRPDFLLLCALGRLPAHDSEDTLRRMLQANLLHALCGGPTIRLQLEGEIVQLMQRLPLSLPAEAV